MAHVAHVSEQKKNDVKEIISLMEEYPVVGIVDVEGLPAPQFQKMRANLKDSVVIKMTKKRLILKSQQIKTRKSLTVTIMRKFMMTHITIVKNPKSLSNDTRTR